MPKITKFTGQDGITYKVRRRSTRMKRRLYELASLNIKELLGALDNSENIRQQVLRQDFAVHEEKRRR